MPTRNRRENDLIALFLSAYDNNTWQGCGKRWLDQEQDGAVEIVATRVSDGATLAIEHTLVQPYASHKKEYQQFSEAFCAIQNDRTLIVPNRGVDVFVSSGALAVGHDWQAIGSTLHDWLRQTVRTLPPGESNEVIAIPRSPTIPLLIRVIEEPGFDGDLRIGIDGSRMPDGVLSSVVEKALRTKVKKLVDTDAPFRQKDDRCILLLERDEPTLSDDAIAAAIESKRHMIDRFDKIHEVWFVENVCQFGNSDYIRFTVRANRRPTKILAFYKGVLQRRYPR